jgi:hypothetical protein
MTRSLILAAAVIAAGAFVGTGFARGRASDRYVTLKGIAEREVRADLAIWPLRLVVADDDLAMAQGRLQDNVREIMRFLARTGVDTSQVALQDFAVTDAYTNQYRTGPVANRFVINQTVVVRSSDPGRVLGASQRVGELVRAGVVFSSGGEYGGSGPTFIFTGLNSLKPEMIAEATARAREAAERFAQDSRSRLGGIRRASQGVFEILPRDQAPGISEESQVVKTVRVVSTVDYFLR